MVLHLNEDKDQNVVFGSSFFSNPVFERRRGEKGCYNSIEISSIQIKICSKTTLRSTKNQSPKLN